MIKFKRNCRIGKLFHVVSCFAMKCFILKPKTKLQGGRVYAWWIASVHYHALPRLHNNKKGAQKIFTSRAKGFVRTSGAQTRSIQTKIMYAPWFHASPGPKNLTSTGFLSKYVTINPNRPAASPSTLSTLWGCARENSSISLMVAWYLAHVLLVHMQFR